MGQGKLKCSKQFENRSQFSNQSRAAEDEESDDGDFAQPFYSLMNSIYYLL